MADDNKSSAMPTPPMPLAGVDPSPPSDAQSPTTLILNHLKSQGMPATSENVRRALEQNQANPGTIKGLISDRPSTEAEDQAAMKAAGQGGGRSATPYVPSGTGGADDTTLLAPSTAPSTGAGGGSSGSSWLVPAILGGLGAGGAGLYGYSRLNRDAAPTPKVGESVPLHGEIMPPTQDPLQIAMERATGQQQLAAPEQKQLAAPEQKPIVGRDETSGPTINLPEHQTTLPYFTSRDANGKLVVSPQVPASILGSGGSPSVTTQIMNPKPTSIVRKPTPSGALAQDLASVIRGLHLR